MSIFDEKQVQEPSMVTLLLAPKMLLKLLIVWMLFVAIGSGVEFFITKHALLSGFDVKQILSAKQILAESTNVAYSPTLPTTQFSSETYAAYPSRIVIPSIGTDLPVSNPQTRDITKLDEALKSSVVRYPDSATLGVQGGNILIFGHSTRLPFIRNSFYKSFNNIETLSKGSVIKVYSGKDIYTYSVERIYKASANDARIPLSVVGHRLTLLTCNSFGKKSDRWVVEANYIGKNI